MRLNSKSNSRSWWRSDVVLALVVLALVLLLHYFTNLFTSLEKKFYDFASAQTGRPPADQIVVLDIDAQSIANIGRWPWSREVHAKALEMLAHAKPKAIGHTVFFTEPQTDKGLVYLRQFKELTADLPADDPLAVRLTTFFSQAEKELDVDTQLARSIKNANKVLLPAAFKIGPVLGKTGEPLPDFVLRNVVSLDTTIRPPTSEGGAQFPIPMLGEAAAGVGHLTQIRDAADGVLRSDPLFIDHDGQWVPSLSLVIAAQALNLTIQDFKPLGDSAYQLGGLKLQLDKDGMFYPQFYPYRKGVKPFVVDSFFDFYSGKISADKYAGKVVLIGSSAEGIADTFVTPASSATPAAELLVHQVSSLMSGHSFSVPYWAGVVTIGAMLAVVMVVGFVLPRTSGGVAAAIAGGLFVVLFATEYLLITQSYLWLPLALPITALVLGYMSLVTKRYLVTEAGKIKSDEQSAESFRQLGLANQGQGRLDEAFDFFRRAPLNDMVMDNLMNLALDFERKRQFNKAHAVYEYMATYNKNHKDLANKLQRAKNLSETVILGGNTGSNSSLLMNGDVEKPTLGRYQLEKELGKGAMGVVYLGKDPRINRIVAIKTMALSQEFEGDELVEARQRFFREAETAGRLQHPQIVTIFDAGEEKDLAYIAMEFLQGKDLLEFTKPQQLLPIPLVVSICARVADALAYAHALNIVHRDIKPANIMYERKTDIVKVTDFGIARVTDSSKTKTGMVLGTPSFMSPEQISGKHVDGRSDLYSLGVMLFQLLTGYLPFRGDSMAELMFKIANEPAPDIRSIRPDISAALAQVVAKALIKQERVREENGIAIQEPVRYQNGTQMAQELRESMGMVTTSPSPMPTPMSEVSAAGTSVVSKPVSSSNVVASTTQTNQAVHVEPLEPTVFEKYETTVVNHPHVQVESSSTDTPSTPSVTSDSTSQH